MRKTCDLQQRDVEKHDFLIKLRLLIISYFIRDVMPLHRWLK